MTWMKRVLSFVSVVAIVGIAVAAQQRVMRRTAPASDETMPIQSVSYCADNTDIAPPPVAPIPPPLTPIAMPIMALAPMPAPQESVTPPPPPATPVELPSKPRAAESTEPPNAPAIPHRVSMRHVDGKMHVEIAKDNDVVMTLVGERVTAEMPVRLQILGGVTIKTPSYEAKCDNVNIDMINGAVSFAERVQIRFGTGPNVTHMRTLVLSAFLDGADRAGVQPVESTTQVAPY